jgi:hypothetical protein
MMERPMCETCPYWDSPSKDTTSGLCCRNAPRSLSSFHDAVDDPVAQWPMTMEWEFCGEHPDFPAYIAATRSGAVSPEVGNSHPSPSSPHPDGLAPSSDGSGG